MKKLLKKTLRKLGYEVFRYNPELDPISDLTAPERQIIATAKPFTKTSVERMASLINIVNYVVKIKFPGPWLNAGSGAAAA